MSEQVQLRRGNTTVNGTFVGAQGEVVVDATLNKLILHDGFTAGGHPVASEAYVRTYLAADTGNITFSGNTISTYITNGNLVIVANGAGQVQIDSPLTVSSTMTGNLSGTANNASYLGGVPAVGYELALGFTPYNATNPAGYITSSASITGTAGNVTYFNQSNITSVGNLTSLISTGNITANSFYSDSGPVIGQHKAPGVVAPGSITADSFITVQATMFPNYFQIGTFDAFGRYETHSEMPNSVLRIGGWSQDGDTLNTGSEGAVIYGNSAIGGTLSSSSGAYARIKANRFGLFAVNSALSAFSAGAYYYRVDDVELYFKSNAGVNTFHIDRNSGDTTIQGNTSIAGNLTVTGNIIANITSVNNAIVYNAGADQNIYTGNIQLNGTSGITVTLPAAYSNTHYRVQISYNANTINTGSFGWIYSNVISSSQFTIHSTTTADYNSVFWTTFGSNIA